MTMKHIISLSFCLVAVLAVLSVSNTAFSQGPFDFNGSAHEVAFDGESYVLTISNIGAGENRVWAKWRFDFTTRSWLFAGYGDLQAEGSFSPDTGIRIHNASNPMACVDDASGKVYLFYEDRSTSPGKRMVAESLDGLMFSDGVDQNTVQTPCDPRNERLPDGSWRRYMYDMLESGMRSQSSTDGVLFTPDEGFRYVPQEIDNGTLGVYDIYADGKGGMVLLYVGDMGGVNNIRRAYSTDNGWTFQLEDANVLGDAGAGGGGHSYVDPKSVLRPDGARWLFTMTQGPLPPLPGARPVGEIYSFISTDQRTYLQPPKLELTTVDFTELELWSLNDPVVVLLPSGEYRMYVAALYCDSPCTSDKTWVIVSAATSGKAE